jgi:site-specific DNA-methyltransferase (adenine-specific)
MENLKESPSDATGASMHPIVHQPFPLDRIICGDNCEVMRKLPSESIDLVVTSPPYDDLRTYGGHSWDFYGVAWNLKRLLKPGGVIVWNVADATIDGSETLTSMKQALHFKEMGFNVHDTMIYAKTSFSNPYPNRYHQVWEYVFILSIGAPKTFNPIEDRKNKNAGCVVSSTVREADGSLSKRSPKLIAENGKRFNVWEMDTAKHDGAVFKHPAIFPEALARDHILSWSNEGDIVLDPFSGSGTTAKMAKHNGRRFIGIEVNPEYVEISEKRLAQGVLF